MTLDTIRTSYDTAAVSYTEALDGDLESNPFDQSVLDLFAGLLKPGERVGDLGCGPGRVTSYLARRGLDAFGIDLSPVMVEVARGKYPGLRFEVGDLFELDLPDDELAGALAWYSLVHTPHDDLSRVFGEIHRVLAPGGLLLVAFMAGSESYHVEQAYGHAVSVDVHLKEPAAVVEALVATGFEEVATMVRQPYSQFDRTPQAYLLVRKSA